MAKSKSQVSEILMEFGLTDVEAEVYQVALSLGARPASVIAQKTGLKRGHTYNVLHALMEKGIVQEFVKGGVKNFTCSPPSSLVAIASARENELKATRERLENIVPDLERLRSMLTAQPKVRFFHGMEGVKEIYEDMLRSAEDEIRCFIDLEIAWSSLDPKGDDFASNFVRRRNEKEIVWRAIVTESETAHRVVGERPSKFRKVKMVPGLSFPAEVSVYGSKISFIGTRDEFVGVVIDHESMAAAIRNNFDYLWNNLPSSVIEK